jgi:hypothetical protein
MPALQTEYITILGAFVRLFSKRIWEHVRILLIVEMIRVGGIGFDVQFWGERLGNASQTFEDNGKPGRAGI